jgi:phospholipid/cholesterol/gamma-HCH transport system substrate-binding protein
MAKKISTIKLGIFIFIGIGLLVLGIFLIGDKQALFSSTFAVKAYFNDIQGLKSGASVRFGGIDVGSVKDVEILNDTTGRVEVTMEILTDIKRFIRTDTKATIETEGLVGNKVVILKMGTTSADHLKDGGVIQSKEPVGFSAIIEETQGIMGYTKQMTKELAEITGRVNRGEGTIGKIFVDEELYNKANRLTERADQSLQAITKELDNVTELFNRLGKGIETVVNNVDKVVVQVDTVISDVREGKGVFGSLLVEGSAYDTLISNAVRNFTLTANDTRLAASRLAENMEALKHNWLFKSYFEDRGYWDKAHYEDEIDSKLEELNGKIKELDERIEALKLLQDKTVGSKTN